MKETVTEILEGPLPPKVAALLDKMDEFGWEPGAMSFVIRAKHPDSDLARPFYAGWNIVQVEGRKASWRFTGAWASNCQALNLNDLMEYMEDPAVIWPEPPDGEGENGSAE